LFDWAHEAGGHWIRQHSVEVAHGQLRVGICALLGAEHESAVAHAKRRQDGLVHVAFVRLPGDGFDHHCQQDVAGIRIRIIAPGARAHAQQAIVRHDVLGQWRRRPRALAEELRQAEVFEAGGMHQQMPHRDGIAGGPRVIDSELRQ